MEHAGVHHVSINVHDAEQTMRFYVDALGLEVLPRPDFGVPGYWLRCGGQEVHLIEMADHKVPDRPQFGPHFALRVRDIDAARDELKSKGIEVSEAMELPTGARQCFLHDPAGNMVELNQPVD